MLFLFYPTEDPCAKCSDDATCEDDKCTCKEGFKGDGETCEGNRYYMWTAHFK